MMDRSGIDLQVVSITANPHVTWAPPGLGLELSQRINDELAWAAQRWPGRIAGWAALPLQEPMLALEEMERALGIGLVGVMVPSHVGQRELDDSFFRPFWDAVCEKNVPVFVHNQAIGGDKRVPASLRHVLGAPMETTLTATRLLFSGLLNRTPAPRLLLTHGGGALPYIIGRLNRGWSVGSQDVIQPGEALRMMWFDTVLHDELCLRYLVDRVGSRHVVVGTDYPYPMAQVPEMSMLEKLDLDQSELRGVVRGNALEFLNLTENPSNAQVSPARTR